MHGIDVTRACGQHQRTATERQLFVGIGTALEQCLNHGGITARRCQPQRRGAIVVGQARFGAGLQQQFGQFCVAAIGGPLQGGGAIGLLCIHVGTAFQQTLDFRLVALACGIGNLSLRERSARHRREQQGSESFQCKATHAVSHRARHTRPGRRSGAVADTVMVNVELIENAQQQVAGRYLLGRKRQMAPALQFAVNCRRSGCAARRSARADSSCPCCCRTAPANDRAACRRHRWCWPVCRRSRPASSRDTG